MCKRHSGVYFCINGDCESYPISSKAKDEQLAYSYFKLLISPASGLKTVKVSRS